MGNQNKSITHVMKSLREINNIIIKNTVDSRFNNPCAYLLDYIWAVRTKGGHTYSYNCVFPEHTYCYYGIFDGEFSNYKYTPNIKCFETVEDAIDYLTENYYDFNIKDIPKLLNFFPNKQNIQKNETTSIKVQRFTPTITNAERINGTRVRGKFRKITVGIGHLSNKSIIG